MKNNYWVKIATLGLPQNTPAPGTAGSLLTCLILMGISYFKIAFSFGLLLPVLVNLLSVLVITQALKYFEESDPTIICLDEVVGMLVSLCLIKLTFLNILKAFFLFRFFDIAKPLGIKKIEKIPGAWGVVLDDVLAGVCANLVLSLWLTF